MTANAIKFYPPTPPRNAIARDGLLGKLKEDKHSKLVIIQAPAGYGKTVLMSQYFNTLVQRGERVSWLALDKADNDVATFLNLVIDSCIHAVTDPAPAAKVEAGMESEGASREFWHWLIDAFADEEMPDYFFMDEFDVIDDSTILDTVSAALSRLPGRRQIIIGSRRSPEFSWSKLQLNNEVTVIGPDELRFSKEECKQFYRENHPTEVAADQVDSIYDQTDGWPAAIQISSLLLRRQSSISSVMNMLDKNQLFSDYVVENILSSQSQEIRDFMLATSILDSLVPDICQHLSGRENAGAMLESMDGEGLFSHRIADHQYRYRKLISSTLREYQRKTRPEESRALHRKACDWFVGHGDPHRALEHALLAEDEDLLAGIIEDNALNFIYNSQLAQVLRWAACLPEERAKTLPKLQLACGWAHVLSRSSEGATEALKNLQGLMEAGHLDMDLAQYCSPIVATSRVLADDMEGIEDSIEKNLRELPDGLLFERLAMNNVLAYVHLTRNKFESARGIVLAVQSSPPTPMSWYTLSYSYVNLAMQQLVMGRLREALDTLKSVKELTSSFEFNDAVVKAIPVPIMAELLYEGNRIQDVKILLEQTLPLIRNQALTDLLISAFITLSRIHSLENEFHLTIKVLEDLERIGYLDHQPRIIATARWEMVRQYQLHGNIARAEDIYHSIVGEGLSSRLAQHCFHPADTEADDITLIRLQLARGEATEARTLLEKALQETHSQRFYRRLKLQILSSLIHHAEGDLERGCNTLLQAVQSCLGEPFVRSFIDEGRPMLELLRQTEMRLRTTAPTRDKLAVTEYIQCLLGHAGAIPEAGLMQPLEQELVEPLTKRELVMLEMIASGLSNKGIAAKLYVSESTVKWHLGNIYSKMGVKKRTQAIANGRQLGLIT